jgi:hypothetical protein
MSVTQVRISARKHEWLRRLDGGVAHAYRKDSSALSLCDRQVRGLVAEVREAEESRCCALCLRKATNAWREELRAQATEG